ncbi:MAG: ABC transporter permease [Clostridia bacterium]|nr:ABC transporter permease [Clostridia bacterium]
MTQLKILIKRDTKLFFKDKMTFFTSMITPLILLLLYVTFLGKVYRDSFVTVIAELNLGIELPDKLIEGCVGGQLMSSLLAVCCITVAFCSNMLMVKDKVNGSVNDLMITPVKNSVMSVAYFVSTAASTLIVCFVATAVYMIYLAFVGWYMSLSDVLLFLLDTFLLVMFGTAFSSIISTFLTSQGQISAVGTVISAGYGFICGAYMPISTFSSGLQKVIAFLPGTHGTALLRSHALNGPLNEMKELGVPETVVTDIKNSLDGSVKVAGEYVGEETMYLVLAGSVVVLLFAYVLIHNLRSRKKRVK